HSFHDLLGTSRHRQNDFGKHHRQRSRTAFPCAQCHQFRREGSKRSDRQSKEPVILRHQQPHSFHRRDPPFQQIPARRAIGSSRTGNHHPHRGHHGKSFFRSDLRPPFPLPGVCAEGL